MCVTFEPSDGITLEAIMLLCQISHVLRSTWKTNWTLKTVCRCIEKCNLNLCYARRKLYICSMQMLLSSLGLSSSQMIHKTWTVISNRCKSRHRSWHGREASVTFIFVLVQYHGRGGVCCDCTETYIVPSMTSFLGSNTMQVSFRVCYNNRVVS